MVLTVDKIVIWGEGTTNLVYRIFNGLNFDDFIGAGHWLADGRATCITVYILVTCLEGTFLPDSRVLQEICAFAMPLIVPVCQFDFC